MPWPVHPTGFFGARGDQDTYRIERSLRFNSADSAYLSRTPSSSGSRTTATLSFWVKRSKLGSYGSIIGGTTYNSTLYFDETPVLNGLSLIDHTGGLTYPLSLRTTQVFRDPSAWYHIVINWDSGNATSSDRVRIYVNGSRITSFNTAVYPSQNYNFTFLSNDAMRIGDRGYGSIPFDGYLTEINFIDGQALTPSSFGETDAITGRWKAKAYSGTYGTNGFYLKFADNSGTTATTLGKDSSPNGNNWTPNNFSVTAGVGNDSLVDSPTNYGTDAGVGGEVRGNYCTINAIFNLNGGVTSDGNLVLTSQNAGGTSAPNGTIGVKSGKWYFEMQAVSNGGFGQPYAGINNGSLFGRFTGNGASSPFATYGTYGVAFDVDAGKLWLTDSTGTWASSGSPSTGANPLETFSGGLETFPYCACARTSGNNASAIGRWNFGQRPFAYTAPTGFKALCTTNLPQPTIQKPSKYMDVVAYTGTGASNSISSLGFSPDFVWIKNRGGATSHAIYDTTRGTQAQLSSDTTGDEVTSSTGLTAFGSNGFTIGTSTLVNTTGTQYVAWAWDQSTQDGFTISTYTGNGANRTISHTLGVAPKMLIVKARTTAGADQAWPVWHTSIANTTYLTLSTTSATSTGTDYWNSTSPTSSVFSVGTNAAVNANNDTYIAYLFSEVEGFSRFGSYTGNGSSDGPFVWCGFRPRWVMFKRTDSTSNWYIYDSARNTVNVVNLELYPDGNFVETNGGDTIDLISSGFKIRTNQPAKNALNGTWIFAAFAESPFKYARAR